MQNRSIARLLFVAGGSLLVVGTASATILNWAGDAVKAGPADLKTDQTEDANHIRGMDEAIIFEPGLDVDRGAIPTGALIQCHILHYDSPIASMALGQFIFDHPVIGLVYKSETLDDWDVPCAVPGMIYPTGVGPRGLEKTTSTGFPPVIVNQDDYVRVISGGYGVEFQADLLGFMDQVRVITCVDCGGEGGGELIADSIDWGEIGEMP